MEAKLIINGVDFAPWCKSGGIQQQYAIRRSRQVVATDGTLYAKEIKKRHISVSLMKLRDTPLLKLSQALKTSPATVTYTDAEYGTLTRTFRISSPQATASSVNGGNTYWSGVSFTLEEV